MKSFYTEIVEWLAQKLLVAGAHRARKMLETFEAEQAVKALPAPRLPEIELH